MMTPKSRRWLFSTSPLPLLLLLLVTLTVPSLTPFGSSALMVVSAFSSQPKQQQKQQHLVLVGGGHAHAQVIKALHHKARPKHLHVTLIDVQKAASYSGMVPACIAGEYTPDQTLLPLDSLAEWAGMEFIQDAVTKIDLNEKKVYGCEGWSLPFDAISLDVGSKSRNLQVIPGARKYSLPTRPIAKLIERVEQAIAETTTTTTESTSTQPIQLVVVGGGAAGLELAMVVTHRWRHELAAANKPIDVQCTLLDAGATLLPQETPQCRARLQSILDELGIHVVHQVQVQQLLQDQIEYTVQTNDSDEKVRRHSLDYTHCLWATGAGAQPLVTQSLHGLDTTEHGWITVRDTLQSTSHDFVFAAGDCADIQLPNTKKPVPKAGVYAVRAGPILVENLTRYLQQQQQETSNPDDDQESSSNDGKLISYQPQDDFLKLLVCGNGKALGFRFGIPLYGKWVFEMKDAIDKSFMQLFSADQLKQEESQIQPGVYDTSQYDAHTGDSVEFLEPPEAAILLQRTDDQVDFRQAWATLRHMARDEEYKTAVLACVEEAASLFPKNLSFLKKKLVFLLFPLFLFLPHGCFVVHVFLPGR